MKVRKLFFCNQGQNDQRSSVASIAIDK